MNNDYPRDIDGLQEAFVRAHQLERREPGGGRWPFAGDGPWNLMQRDHVDDTPSLEDRSITLLETEGGQMLEVRKRDSRAPRVPLSAAEVDELATLRRWLQLVPDCGAEAGGRGAPLPAEHDRKLVWAVTGCLARGDADEGGRVAWSAIGRRMGSPRSPDALALRYRRAMARVVCALQGWPERRAKAMAA